jgi:hypothetical protein
MKERQQPEREAMTHARHVAIEKPVSERALLHEIATVVADVPRFLAAPLVRRWHLRWGATPEEAAAAMPGDDLLADAHFQATRAITIDAHPHEVWPWLVQVGCLRAGWYSDDLLDNLGQPSADRIVRELQDLEVGQWVPMAPTPNERTAFRVEAFETDHWLVWRQPLSTWSWQLESMSYLRTRLVTRLRIRYDWRYPVRALVSMLLVELGDFAMMRRMLLGIKARAERPVRGPSTLSGLTAEGGD